MTTQTHALTHPSQALFGGEKSFPIIPSCEHFAGSEKLILKALALQDTIGPVFDITCDCEDGAMAGQEHEHAEMIVRVLKSDANKHQMAGARIHDYTHPHWQQDIDILVKGAGQVLSYITIPKSNTCTHGKAAMLCTAFNAPCVSTKICTGILRLILLIFATC